MFHGCPLAYKDKETGENKDVQPSQQVKVRSQKSRRHGDKSFKHLFHTNLQTLQRLCSGQDVPAEDRSQSKLTVDSLKSVSVSGPLQETI